MKQLRFCVSCIFAVPRAEQKVWFVGGKAFCRPECQEYLKEIQAERERKHASFIEKYGPRSENWST